LKCCSSKIHSYQQIQKSKQWWELVMLNKPRLRDPPSSLHVKTLRIPMKATKTGKHNLGTPGVPMSEGKFHALLEEAEKGDFKSVTKLKKRSALLMEKETLKVVRWPRTSFVRASAAPSGTLGWQGQMIRDKDNSPHCARCV
jgi:hypothetical protein